MGFGETRNDVDDGNVERNTKLILIHMIRISFHFNILSKTTENE